MRPRFRLSILIPLALGLLAPLTGAAPILRSCDMTKARSGRMWRLPSPSLPTNRLPVTFAMKPYGKPVWIRLLVHFGCTGGWGHGCSAHDCFLRRVGMVMGL